MAGMTDDQLKAIGERVKAWAHSARYSETARDRADLYTEVLRMRKLIDRIGMSAKDAEVDRFDETHPAY